MTLRPGDRNPLVHRQRMATHKDNVTNVYTDALLSVMQVSARTVS